MEDTIVIIPTLNEEENIGQIVPVVLETCPGISVLVVDDNSHDHTQEIVRNLVTQPPSRVHLLARNVSPGYGHSILDGLRWVREHGCKYAISLDADSSHPISAIPPLIKLLEYSDVAIGSRYVKGGGIANWKLHRRLLSRFANLYVRLILNMPINDVTSGFVAYNNKAIDKILEANPDSEGYSFLVEAKFVLSKTGLRIREYPITFTDRREGQSKMSGKKIWESVWVPWRLLFNSLVKPQAGEIVD
ncbi:MAG TPA: polyprenol monophosphomannose synthase [Candidatus Paceibacterota bacterium]